MNLPHGASRCRSPESWQVSEDEITTASEPVPALHDSECVASNSESATGRQGATQSPGRAKDDSAPRLYVTDYFFALQACDLGTSPISPDAPARRQVNLAARYPIAVVKALHYAGGRCVENDVPAELRLFEGGLFTSQGVHVARFEFGQYRGRTVKDILRADPSYLRWVFAETDIERHRSGYDWNQVGLEIKSWILWYMPNLVEGKIGGPLFTAFRAPQQQATVANAI